MLKNLFASLIGLIASALMMEVGLRAYGFSNVTNSTAVEYYARIAKKRLQEIATKRPSEIYMVDERLGWRHRPGTHDTHVSPHFSVTYTIDERGYRVGSKAASYRPEVLFLGDSFTFGAGVEDHQPYPRVLGETFWRDWHVSNAEVSAWGTTQAYLLLEEILAKPERPDVVVYAMIRHNVLRNVPRRGWMRFLGPGHNHLPLFEVKEGRAEFVRLVGHDDPIAGRKDTRAERIEVTRLLIVQMHEECKRRGIPFFFILLPHGPPDWPAGIIRTVMEQGIPLIDLTQLEVLTLKGDAHPSPDGHVQIARAISRSVLGQTLSEWQQRQN